MHSIRTEGRWRRGVALLAATLMLAVGLARADTVAELEQLHLAALGGAANVAALHALHATGRTVLHGQTLPFSLWAERPDWVRIETKAAGRTLIQGYDGTGEPWQSDSAVNGGRAQLMDYKDARDFTDGADFDDPLVDAAARGISVDDAGPAVLDGRDVHRLLITNSRGQTSTLFLDAQSHLLIRRVDTRRAANNLDVEIETDYGDYRPLDGVMLPRHIVVSADGRRRYETFVDAMEANPLIVFGWFSPPGGAAVD